MARKISDIQQSITDSLTASVQNLSQSNAAEWRLWSYVVALAIHSFEVIMDVFKREINEAADKIIPGTVRWYAEQARRFQNGHELIYDKQTAQLYYASDDPAARIISVVAVSEGEKNLFIKVAKTNDQNEIAPLSDDELYNFSAYLDAIKRAGITTSAISTEADLIKYDMTVYFDPAIPMTTVRQNVLDALDAFRIQIGFDSRFYAQKFINAVLSATGVVTVNVPSLARKAVGMADYVEVGVADELHAGYFDYAPDSAIQMENSKNVPL